MFAGSVTNSRVSDTPSTTGAQRSLIALGRAGLAADDDDLAQRRLLIVLELGPIAVIAPCAKRSAKADACRRIGVISRPLRSITACFSPDVSNRATAVPPSFSAASRGDAPCRVPTTSRRRDAAIVIDELLGRRRRFAFEPLAIESRCHRLLRAAQATRASTRSLPATGKTSAKSPVGRLSAKRIFMCGDPDKGERSPRPLGCKSSLAKERQSRSGQLSPRARCDRRSRTRSFEAGADKRCGRNLSGGRRFPCSCRSRPPRVLRSLSRQPRRRD